MFTRIALAAAIVAAPLASTAGDDYVAEIARQALRCSNPPPAFIRQWSDARATFDVTLDEAGRVQDIAVVEYSPPERDLVLAFSKGIQLCGPYGAPPDGAGVYRIEMSDRPQLIDPFD